MLIVYISLEGDSGGPFSNFSKAQVDRNMAGASMFQNRSSFWSDDKHTLDSPLKVQVDSNGNGSLDSREIEVLLNSLAADTLGEGRRVSKAEIRNVMEKVDSNKDRRIAFDEFIRVSARCPRALLQA